MLVVASLNWGNVYSTNVYVSFKMNRNQCQRFTELKQWGDGNHGCRMITGLYTIDL